MTTQEALLNPATKKKKNTSSSDDTTVVQIIIKVVTPTTTSEVDKAGEIAFTKPTTIMATPTQLFQFESQKPR
jgi:hypothetical protein